MSTRVDIRVEAELGLRTGLTALRAGQCIVLPTDTVYGIGALAQDPAAVARLLAAKGRSGALPPPVLVADLGDLEDLVAELPAGARSLAQAHWPGALTLVLRTRASAGLHLGELDQTIAVRIPDLEFTRALLRQSGPLAVSSANRHALPAATTIDAACRMLGERVAVYLDAGNSPTAVPSTIVDYSSGAPRVLRYGALDRGTLAASDPQLGDGAETDA